MGSRPRIYPCSRSTILRRLPTTASTDLSGKRRAPTFSLLGNAWKQPSSDLSVYPLHDPPASAHNRQHGSIGQAPRAGVLSLGKCLEAAVLGCIRGRRVIPSVRFGMRSWRRRGAVSSRCQSVPRTRSGRARRHRGASRKRVCPTTRPRRDRCPRLGLCRTGCCPSRLSVQKDWRRGVGVGIARSRRDWVFQRFEIGVESQRIPVVVDADHEGSSLSVEETADGFDDGVLHLLVLLIRKHVPTGRRFEFDFLRFVAAEDVCE